MYTVPARHRFLAVGLLAALCGSLGGVALAVPTAPTLQLVATYSSGLGGNGAEIVSSRSHDGIAVVTNIAGSVDVLDLSDATAPTLARRVPVDLTLGTPNSAAIHPHLDYFLVVSGQAGLQGIVRAYRLSDGELLASAPLGIQPDSIAIAPNGQYAVVANEAEGTGPGGNGGAGSLSLVSLVGFTGVTGGVLDVTAIALPSQSGVAGFSVGRTDGIASLLVDNAPASLEPESVAFSPDSRHAYITL